MKTKLYTTKTAAKLLDLSPDYIRRLLLDGKIKGEKLGKEWLIPSYALQAYQKRVGKELHHGSGESIKQVDSSVD